jgi:hypothetical protein
MSELGTSMARADAALRTAIETLYERFDGYGRPKRMHAAPTRDIEAIMSALTSAPLRELSPEALDGYSTSAMTTVGEPEDYLHFFAAHIRARANRKKLEWS